MSARAAVYRLLSEDPELKSAWGIDGDWVYPAQSLDTPPGDHYFLVMRWAETTPGSNLASKTEILTVWAHSAKTFSADYADLVRILNRVRDVLTGISHVAGEDGIMTLAHYRGMSPDFDDPVMMTITKNIEFQILSR